MSKQNQIDEGPSADQGDLSDFETRKSNILAESKVLLRSTCRRRQFTRKALFAVVPVMLFVLVTIFVVQFQKVADTDRVSSIPVEFEVKVKPMLVFEVISDEVLLDTLAELGQPSVLATVGNELKLVRQQNRR